MSSLKRYPLKVLIIEDSEDDLLLLLNDLRAGGFDTTYTQVQDKDALKKALENDVFQVVISDFSLPRLNARDALELVKPTGIPFFVLSGTIGENLAVEMMRAGAQDYVMKGNTQRLIPAIYRELDEMQLRQSMQSKLQQREDQLRQAQKMEAIGRLAGGIAHDFNNFLGAILMMNEVILNKVGKDHSAHKDLLQIQDAIERAANLPRQLLTFSRQQAVEMATIDVNTVVTSIQKMLERVLKNDMDLTVNLENGINQIQIGRGQFEQILMNLVVNARDAMGTQGSIHIKTANVELLEPIHTVHSEIKPGNYVVVSVMDTGSGMDETTLKCIFEPFFTTKGMNGTGLGLSTVFGIVQKANGYIDVKSTLGKGSSFEIYLPICTAEPHKNISTIKEPIATRGAETIFVVEDQNELRQVLVACLKKEKYNVLEAPTAIEALELLKKHPQPVDLLITDLMMEKMNGVELIETLAPKMPEMKIILMSGYMDQTLISDAKLPADMQFLQKPFSTKMALERIRIALSENKTNKKLSA